MNQFENQIEQLLARDSFVRWIEGEADARESLKWEKWMNDDPARKKMVKEAKTLHQTFQFRQSKRLDTEMELDKLHQSISKLDSSYKQQKIPLMFIQKEKRYYRHVAAIIVFLLVVFSVISFLEFDTPVQQQEVEPIYTTTTTDYGQKKLLTLSDGSTIMLNANSSLRYPSNREERDALEVWLNGEAYFDIVHKSGEKARTFSVHTGDGKIEVLGTKFNVNTYQRETEVVLEKGSVRVELKDTLSRYSQVLTMKPGEITRFSNSRDSIKIGQIQPELRTSWIKDKLVFDRTPLQYVAQRVEYIYGVQFSISDPELQQTLISGSVPNDNLPVLLNALSKMLEQPVVNEKGVIRLGKKRAKKSATRSE